MHEVIAASGNFAGAASARHFPLSAAGVRARIMAALRHDIAGAVARRKCAVRFNRAADI
jgi:hypothetical protein